MRYSWIALAITSASVLSRSKFLHEAKLKKKLRAISYNASPWDPTDSPKYANGVKQENDLISSAKSDQLASFNNTGKATGVKRMQEVVHRLSDTPTRCFLVRACCPTPSSEEPVPVVLAQ